MEADLTDESSAGAHLDRVLDGVCGRGFSAVIEYQFHQVLGVGLYGALLHDPLSAEGVLAMVLGGQGAVDFLFGAVEGELHLPLGEGDRVRGQRRLALRI